MTNNQLTRRELLKRAGCGFGGLALADLCAREAGHRPGPHFAPRAKRVIFLFMHGGVSQIDTFDYKPALQKDSGKPLPFPKPRVTFADTKNLMKSPWAFKQHGECGQWVSELFPHVAGVVDDLTFIKSLHGSNPAHGGALLKINTGSETFVRPSMGSWISYGLGTEAENLPSYIVMNPTMGHGGVRNYGAAFLPPQHQGTRIAGKGAHKYEEMRNADISFIRNTRFSADEQRRQLALLKQISDDRLKERRDPELEARIKSFELAFKMQTAAPVVMDIDGESAATKKLYGIDDKNTEYFGRQCLLARRFAESGVRFVQCTHNYWDQHDNLRKKHAQLSSQVDKPIAGLINDLKSRGMLDDTLVIWGTEFGRTPVMQNNDGRDHNPHGFTWWMAGAGLKPGYSYGNTDEYGFYAVENKVHVHDLHATILHLLGLDHEALTYRYAGRDFRLTDVEGEVVHDIMG
jgi:hypothetical protein